MDLVEMVNSMSNADDKICIIGDDINVRGNSIRLSVYDFMTRDDRFDIVVLNNVSLAWDKFVDLVESASKRAEVLVCDFRRDRKRAGIDEPIVKDTTVEYYDDLGRLSAYLYKYPFVYAYNGYGSPSFLAIYFRRMLPSMTGV